MHNFHCLNTLRLIEKFTFLIDFASELKIFLIFQAYHNIFNFLNIFTVKINGSDISM